MTAGKVSSWRFRAICAAAAAACALVSLPTAAADRVALLIGNNQYSSNALRNAVNDARDLSDALKDLGFQVIVRENASRKDMIDAIREFGQAIEGASAALFFYAGHAMQFKERNYLIPIDAAMGSEEDVTFFSVEVSQVFDRMDRARTRFNFIILDACRDNPFAASFKLTSAGLAQMSTPSGTLIAYATSPGATAADGFGRNGIYTKHILQNIRANDLPVEIMFKRVREGVERETRKLQTPWDSSSLKGDFAFNPSAAHASAAAAPGAGPSADATLHMEREFWISVRDSMRLEDIRAYLDKYPNGNFAALARNKLDALARPGPAAAAEPGPPPSTSRIDASAKGPALVATAPTPAAGVPAATPAVPGSAAAARAQRDPPPEFAGAPRGAADGPVVAAVRPSSAPEAKAPELQLGREIAPGIREVTFDDGSVYRGATRARTIHGKGKYVSKAYMYEGEFEDGMKQGEGTCVWDNGDRYQGQFAGDVPDGRGKYQYSSGDVYEGEMKRGVVMGRGTYTSRTGDVMEGSFVNGKPQGVGVFRFANGDRYEGEIDQGRLHGRGVYHSKNGDRLEAPFVDGKAQGTGVYRFATGDRYEGELRAGTITGQGSYFYASGMKYEGEMRLGQPNGRGVYWFVDGTRFEGVFENGLAGARGELIKPDGSRAQAEIVEGKTRILD
jgi:hypothetical protein